MTDTASMTDTAPRRPPSEEPEDSSQKSDQDGEDAPQESSGAVPALADCVEAIEEDTRPQEPPADEQSTESGSSTRPRYVYD